MANLGLGISIASGVTQLSDVTPGPPDPSATLTVDNVTVVGDSIIIKIGYTTNVAGKISVLAKDLSATPKTRAESYGNAVSATTGTLSITFGVGDLVGGAIADLDQIVAYIVESTDTNSWNNRFANITQGSASWVAEPGGTISITEHCVGLASAFVKLSHTALVTSNATIQLKISGSSQVIRAEKYSLTASAGSGTIEHTFSLSDFDYDQFALPTATNAGATTGNYVYASSDRPSMRFLVDPSTLSLSNFATGKAYTIHEVELQSEEPINLLVENDNGTTTWVGQSEGDRANNWEVVTRPDAITKVDSYITPSGTNAWAQRYDDASEDVTGLSCTSKDVDQFDILTVPSGQNSDVVATYIWSASDNKYFKVGSTTIYIYKLDLGGGDYGWVLHRNGQDQRYGNTWQYTYDPDPLTHQSGYTHGNVYYE